MITKMADAVVTLTRGASKIFEAHGSGAGPGNWVTDLRGWDGSPGVRTDGNFPRSTIGTTARPTIYDGRAISIFGETDCIDVAATMQAETEIGGLFRSDFEDNAPVTLRIVHHDQDLSAVVDLDGIISAKADCTRLSVIWTIPLLAPDPRRYGPVREGSLLPIGTGRGLRWPLFESGYLDWGEAVNTTVTITNAGTSDAYPVFRVMGNMASGFALVSGDRALIFGQPVYPQSPVTVDMAGHVWVGGMERSVWLTRREWFSVPAKGAIQVQLVPLQQGGTGQATFTVRDTWT